MDSTIDIFMNPNETYGAMSQTMTPLGRQR
jgi:hypothetical protein